MSDLVTFLRARLDEDEHIAKAAIQGPWRTGEIADHLIDDVIYGRSPFAFDGPHGDKIVQVANLEMAWQKRENIAHIARHDPARVLREVKAKRRIVDELSFGLAETRRGRDTGDGEGLSETVLGLLALPYADHPDHRDEWLNP